jgi:predicted ATPase
MRISPSVAFCGDPDIAKQVFHHMVRLKSVHVEGFKSLRDVDIALGDLNLLIGANGSGKSNFVAGFRFLRELVAGNLKVHTARLGGANDLLYFGRKTTDAVRFQLNFSSEPLGEQEQLFSYSCTLAPSADDTFVFLDERVYGPPIVGTEAGDNGGATSVINLQSMPSLGAGHVESMLRQNGELGEGLRQVRDAIQGWRIYHFHDTSESAAVKQTGDIHDNRFLRSDAGNLAAYLYLLREVDRACYDRIVASIRLIAPFFDDFSLRPSPLNPDKIRLEWSETGSDIVFGASALSDGTLRFMALATLLLQGNHSLPTVILLDEPELGLHPYAIVVLGSLLKSVSKQTQVIVSTQSVTLVNQFEPQDIIVVERSHHATVFRRFGDAEVASWLDDYGLGDLWEKNVLGGRPSA